MIINRSVTFDISVEVGEEHTELTGLVAADTAIRLIISECLIDEERGGCQIVDVDAVQDIYVS